LRVSFCLDRKYRNAGREKEGYMSYEDGLTNAMTTVWEERQKHSVLSEEFFVLTKVWESLFEQRCRAEDAEKQERR
jgi:hypothetical protein